MAVDTPHADWREEFGVIDMHTHIGAKPRHIEAAVEYMEQNNIRAFVDISPNTGDRFWEFSEAISDHPDRFGLFGGFDFDGFSEDGWVDRQLEWMEEAVDAGAVGFKIHKAFGMVYTDENDEHIKVDDERMAPIFEKAAELNTVIAFHIADPQSFFVQRKDMNDRWAEQGWWWGDREKHPYQWWELVRQLERVIERHPETTFLGVHWGCASEEVGYVADVMRQNPNYIIDVSARLPWIGTHRPDLVRDVFLEFQDRILFGTDFAVRDTMMLGIPQDFDPTDEDIERFFDAHWEYFETDGVGIENPTPWFEDWTLEGIDLPRDVLEKFYVKNAQNHLGI